MKNKLQKLKDALQETGETEETGDIWEKGGTGDTDDTGETCLTGPTISRHDLTEISNRETLKNS